MLGVCFQKWRFLSAHTNLNRFHYQKCHFLIAYINISEFHSKKRPFLQSLPPNRIKYTRLLDFAVSSAMTFSGNLLLSESFADTLGIFRLIGNTRTVTAIIFHKTCDFLINIVVRIFDNFQQSTAPLWLPLARVMPRTSSYRESLPGTNLPNFITILPSIHSLLSSLLISSASYPV